MPTPSAAVAYQGEKGAYSEMAAAALMPGVPAVGFDAFADVFAALARGRVDGAVVPVENSIFGAVHDVLDGLQAQPVQIVEARWLRIQHCLMALPGTTPEAVREVWSHPQALGQCRAFLAAHLPHARALSAHDTAGAARRVRDEGRRDVAVIAARRAADVYGLAVMAEGIETHAHNATRFLALVRPADAPLPPPDARTATAVLYPRPGVPRALARCLDVFADEGWRAGHVECRPHADEPFQHVYFVDVLASDAAAAPARVVLALEKWAAWTKWLGPYPTRP